MRWPPPCPEVTSCPLVSGSQSRAPGAAGGEGLRAQEGVGVSPGGAEHSAAAEGPPGERAGGAAHRPGPGTFLLLPPSSCGFGARSRPLPLASPAWALGPSPGVSDSPWPVGTLPPTTKCWPHLLLSAPLPRPSYHLSWPHLRSPETSPLWGSFFHPPAPAGTPPQHGTHPSLGTSSSAWGALCP